MAKKVVYASFSLGSGEEVKPFTVRVPASLLDTIDRQAEIRGQSRGFIVHQALELYAHMLRGGYTVAKFEVFEDQGGGAGSPTSDGGRES